jgi:hypothetical protein
MSNPVLNAPGPNRHKLEMLRRHFAQTVTESQGYSEEKQRLRG